MQAHRPASVCLQFRELLCIACLCHLWKGEAKLQCSRHWIDTSFLEIGKRTQGALGKEQRVMLVHPFDTPCLLCRDRSGCEFYRLCRGCRRCRGYGLYDLCRLRRVTVLRWYGFGICIAQRLVANDG